MLSLTNSKQFRQKVLVTAADHLMFYCVGDFLEIKLRRCTDLATHEFHECCSIINGIQSKARCRSSIA